MCDSVDRFKIAKFSAKTTSHGHRLGDVDGVQRRSRFAQKGHNWWRITISPGNDIESKVQSWQWKHPEEPRQKKARLVRSNVKVLSIFFLRLNRMEHHDFLPQGRKSISNITLKLYVDCIKQFVRNAQNCGKTNHGFCKMITYQLTLVREFLVKYMLVVIMPQPQYSSSLATDDLFLFPKLKTPMKGKCFATIEEIKEKEISTRT